MSEVPRHPDTDHEHVRTAAAPRRVRPWWVYAIAAAAVTLLVLVVVLHLTGVIGPESH